MISLGIQSACCCVSVVAPAGKTRLLFMLTCAFADIVFWERLP